MNLSEISVDRHAEVPIGVQLAWLLRTRIHDGGLRPGDRLPGLRDLADATGVNINTVKAVYQRLHSEGLIDSQQGSGTFVASVRRGGSDAARIATNAAHIAQDAGVDAREVAAALYVTPPGAAPGDEALTARRDLRNQIAVLERALGELDAAHPGLLPPAVAVRRPAGPSLLSVGELEGVRRHVLRRLVLLQRAIDGDPPPDETGRGAAESTARESTAARARASAPEAARKTPVQSKRPVRPPRGRPATAEG